jgi:hypothetical protein
VDLCRECCVRIVSYRSLRRADHPSGVVRNVVCLSVIQEPYRGGLGSLGLSIKPWKKSFGSLDCIYMVMNTDSQLGVSNCIGDCTVWFWFNPLTPELNPSAQRCLTRFFTGDFALTVHFVNICVKNQQIHQLFIQFINYVSFGITLPSSGSVPSAFWKMLNWGAVDRILWMGVFWDLRSPRTTSLDTTRPSPIFYRLLLNWVSLKALGTLSEDGNVMPKHVGSTIHN